jgi:hypothetical protein
MTTEAPLIFIHTYDPDASEEVQEFLTLACTSPERGADLCLDLATEWAKLGAALNIIRADPSPASATRSATETLTRSWERLASVISDLTCLRPEIQGEARGELDLFRAVINAKVNSIVPQIMSACKLMLDQANGCPPRKLIFPEWYQRIKAGTCLDYKWASFCLEIADET